ncbi:hypothetical protein K491DRAFT_549835, partial [Lophiostoma macrostomum CBS 122681]
PPDLDIDRKTPLLHTMAPYSEHVLVCTGREDWSSRIEDEEGVEGDFVRGLKGVVGKGGGLFDPYNNVLITASSFPLPNDKHSKDPTTSILLFPSFTRITAIPHDTPTLQTLATSYLHAPQPSTLPHLQRPPPPSHDTGSKADADADAQSRLHAEPVTKPTILICGHGGRDKRCGVLGPLLQAQFRAVLEEKRVDADVGLISHIGGHKFAGNVIVYLPPSRLPSPSPANTNTLDGCGIWYGRVGPEQVEGVVQETVVQGKIIQELFRGGVGKGGVNL